MIQGRNFGRNLALAALVAVSTLIAGQARAEHTRVTYPNAIALEVLGRGLMYSLSFDRVVNDDMVVGIGYGRVALRTAGDQDAGKSTSLVPVYLNYYFAQDANSLFVTAGADLVINSDDAKDLKAQYSGLKFSSTPVLPTFGAGFESRSDTGFLMRIAAYGIVADNIRPWVGLTLGYAF